ncbi:ABC transporter substrate-binding protein [Nocardioides sp. zg-536]|uniref:ABC transporter substrate-binding protein n=1 Tax=Nocardioides faecalis TaxID=2803858 RepID=A0A938YAM6_9ACTN|nr:ABC transporter substrate-binding protein [Nocardioides faecalis]MBM9460354.1 ABC transporter substrate-binding protein [Nocardioides faecalis]MBS4751279.1 ABC transporter substrate-binding protein [Nocardioides faecalis]QVI59818.1 ABC transporter substrate-binding protein [Nocardioides faecalis]
MIATAALALAACGGSEAAGGDGSLRVGVNHWVAKAAINLGTENDRFADEGIDDIKLETVGAAPAVIAALQSNKVDIAVLPTTSYLDALSKGIKLTAVAPLTGFPSDGEDQQKYDGFDFFVQPEAKIERPRDLEGKTVAVGARGDLVEMSISYLMTEDGGDPKKVDWIQLVAAPALEAFKAKRLDAAAFALPFADGAQTAGGEILTRLTWPLLDGAPILMWIGSPDLAKDAERLKTVQRALLSTNETANADPEGTLAAAAKEAGISVETMKARPEAFYFPTSYDKAELEALAQKMSDMGFLKNMPDIDASFATLPDAK